MPLIDYRNDPVDEWDSNSDTEVKEKTMSSISVRSGNDSGGCDGFQTFGDAKIGARDGHIHHSGDLYSCDSKEREDERGVR